MEGKLDLPEKGGEMKEPPQSQLQQSVAEDKSCGCERRDVAHTVI